MASYEELLAETGKEYLTPTEFKILNERKRSGTLEDMFMGSGKAYAGMARDLYKSNIEGDEKFDRDWNWSDAMTPAYDAMSLFGFRPLAAAMKSKLAAGAAKGAGKGLQKGYNAATGAKRGVKPKAAGGKKSLEAPDGKPGQLALPGPKGAPTPTAKPGMMQKAGTAIKNNPKTAAALGLAGVGGAAAGINAMLPDEPEGLDPLEQPVNNEVVDPAANQNLDNPNGQMAMTPEGKAQAAMQVKANNLPKNVALGTGGATTGNRAQMNIQAQADKMAGDIIDMQNGSYDPTASEDKNGFLRNRYDATGGRRPGAWDRLSEAKKDEMAANYSKKSSSYDSSSDAGKAVDARLKESGYTPPMADPQSQAEGRAMAEQNRLQELDAAVEAQQSGAAGSYGVAADPENYQGSLKTMDKAAFSDKTGMQAEGTGIVDTTLDGTGRKTTLEMGGQFNKAGGMETALPHLSAAQQVNLERQTERPGSYTDIFGENQDMSEDTVRMTSDEQGYSDANFENRDDALAYLNRGQSEAPEAPEAPEEEGYNPNEGEEDEGFDWQKYAPYAAPLALAHPATRKWGSKMMPKLVNKFKGVKPKQLEGNFYNATPIPRFPGQAPRLGNSPMQLPNRAPGLPNNAPGLPHRAPGLPFRADPNAVKGLPNKSMSAPAGRQVTPEQFRRGQTGAGPSERASAIGAKQSGEKAAADRITQMNRKAQMEREARARRLAGQPLKPNPYGVPGSQIHMNGQLPAQRPPFPL